MEWVKINDELPPKDGNYRTKSAYYEAGRKMKFMKDSGTKETPFSDRYNVWFSDRTSRTSSVTHWQRV